MTWRLLLFFQLQTAKLIHFLNSSYLQFLDFTCKQIASQGFSPQERWSAKVAFKKSSQLSDLISKQDSCMTTKKHVRKRIDRSHRSMEVSWGFFSKQPQVFWVQKKPWLVCSSKFLCEDGVGYIQILRNLPSSFGPKFPLPSRLAPWRVSGCHQDQSWEPRGCEYSGYELRMSQTAVHQKN